MNIVRLSRGSRVSSIFPMSYKLNDITSKLPTSPKTKRFIEEIRAHCEDGDETHIGEPEHLLTAFTMYAYASQKRDLIIVAITGIVTLVWTTCALAAYLGGFDNLQTPIILMLLPGWALMIPILLPGALIFSLVGDAFNPPFFLAPILTTMLWTTVAYMLLFSPPKFLRRNKRYTQ